MVVKSKGNGTPAISGKSRLVKYYHGGGFKYVFYFHPNPWGR